MAEARLQRRRRSRAVNPGQVARCRGSRLIEVMGAASMPKPAADKLQSRDREAGWASQNLAGRHAVLTGILAQVSREALQGEGLDAILQRIVDYLVGRLPIQVASIILLDRDNRNFVQEVLAGELHLDMPATLPWPVTMGAAGRCVRSGQAQLIAAARRS